MNDELERVRKEAVVPYSGIRLEGLRKTTKIWVRVVSVLVDVRTENLPNANECVNASVNLLRASPAEDSDVCSIGA
jgi:hypothetical protein